MRSGLSVFVVALMLGVMFHALAPWATEENHASKLSWREWALSGRHSP